MSTDVDADDLGDAESLFPGDVLLFSTLRLENCVNFVILFIQYMYVSIIGCIILFMIRNTIQLGKHNFHSFNLLPQFFIVLLSAKDQHATRGDEIKFRISEICID